jgi:hypothetical protein
VIKTNLVERLRVDTSGNIGIGTPSPTTQLQVNGNTGICQNRLYLSGGDGWASLTYNSHHDSTNTSWVFPDPTRTAVTLEMDDLGGVGSRFEVWSTLPGATTSWLRRLAIDGTTGNVCIVENGGAVGVGTNAPTYSLHLANGKALRIEGGTSATDAGNYFSFGGNGSFGIDAPGVVNGRFVVQNSGQVGVGAIAPRTKLHVEGASDQSATIAISRSDNNKFMRLGVGTGGVALDFDPTSFFVIQKNTLGIDGILNGQELLRVTADGNLTISGDILLTGADCAEHFDVIGSPPEPGTLVVIDHDGLLRASHDAYDKKVAGVVSGAGHYRPGIVLDKRPAAECRVPVALLGKVYCKVDAQYGPIEVGDLLTASETPGHAMKGSDPARVFGSVIGKALKPLQTGMGLIPILVALQ